MTVRSLRSLALVLFVTALGSTQVVSESVAQKPTSGPTLRVVVTSEVKWGPLNPARGDKGPRAGNLWGDRTGSGPTGFLVKFADGFSSPPHIHNITYRALVIRGLIYNGGPKAERMWMPAGSYWTQPAGGVHITAAKGRNNLVYVEIAKGPYLVLPTEKAFLSKDKPINVDVSNLVWINQPGVPTSANGTKVAYLWGNPQDDQPSGTLVKLPARYTGILRSHGSTLRAVVIQGRPKHRVPGKTNVKAMEPGSYFGSKGETAHWVSCEARAECILYVRMEGKFDVIPMGSDK